MMWGVGRPGDELGLQLAEGLRELGVRGAGTSCGSPWCPQSPH